MGAVRPGRGGPAGAHRAERARARLVRELVAAGELTDPRWRAAFEAVPRHAFVPAFHDSVPGGYERVAADDPDPVRRDRWLRGVYEDTPLALRIENGELLVSSSQPSLMALMLDALAVEDGCRVLEIGTGSGYNAALLAHRLGDRAVTTIDLDEEITAPARDRLAAAGYHPEVVTGDGALGCPRRAPFDRIIATCSPGAVPPAWPAQCTPGARIVTPLATGLVALRVTGPGGRAEGRFLHTPAYFVPLRGDGATDRAPDAVGYGLPPEAPADDRFHFLLTLCAGRLLPEEAYELWRREHKPGHGRYGVTVEGDRQWAWLDSPGGPYAWELGGTAGRADGA